MLVRSIALSKWQRAYLFMKRNSLKEVIVEEKYNYEQREEDNIFEPALKSLWVYGILSIDYIDVMVTSLLPKEFARMSQERILSYLREHPNQWLAEDSTTLQSVPICRQEHLIDLLARAALARALEAPDLENRTY